MNDDKPKQLMFTIYRDHLCYVSEDYGDGEYDLEILADELVGGGYVRCDHARQQFSMVRPTEFFVLTKIEPEQPK